MAETWLMINGELRLMELKAENDKPPEKLKAHEGKKLYRRFGLRLDHAIRDWIIR